MAPTCSFARPVSAVRTWASRCELVAPASRNSSVSPTQRIGVISWRSTARSVRATASSVMSKIWRRSECPTSTLGDAEARQHLGADLAGERPAVS